MSVNETVTREAERGALALEHTLMLRDMVKAIASSARAGNPKAVRLTREMVGQLHRLGMSGPPLIALLTEEV
ncbi:hypothetical protein [Nocardia wallacei]|uniref:hypothetical protein n=1 Tax=Nocardia wallacei TaxID=480035 RepID=UPI002454584A|nr:hypothetical protein [Nocardia wallacei]